MRRETQHALILLLGGALLRIAADDTYLRYVRPSHRWLLLATGLAMVWLAVVALWRDSRSRPIVENAGHDHAGADRHMPWLLVVPVLTIALVAPPALGADAVTRAGAANAVLGADDVFGPLPAGAPELPIAELVQRASAGAAGEVDNREVTLTGFVVRRGDAVDLARLTIACCAADARATRVHLAGDLGAPAPASDTWLRVRGTVAPGSATAATGYVPTLTIIDTTVVPAPPDQYEY